MLALLSTSPSGLEQLWFTLIGVLWLGYFFLEGFDFGVGTLLPIVGVCVLAVVSWLVRERLEGWAFVATAVVIVAFFTTLLLNLYPNVLVSSVSPHFDLTIIASASHPYTLKVMSWVALIFTPFVLLYQSWTYWIFKKRVRRPESQSDADLGTINV